MTTKQRIAAEEIVARSFATAEAEQRMAAADYAFLDTFLSLKGDERVAFRDPLAGSDEDGRHSRGGGRRELGEPPGPGHHRADGPHDLGEGLHRRHGGRGADDGLSGGRRAGLGVLAVRAGPAGREQRGGRAEQRAALHGWSAPVRSRKAAAASFAAATSSM